MGKENMYRNLNDCQISPTEIPQKYTSLTPQRAMMIRDEVKIGNYISIVNQNNLSEVLIYRRNNFLNDDLKVMRWDGETINYEWYDNPDKDTYTIANAEQLAGLGELIAYGNDFSGKTIKLSANINLNNKEWIPIGGHYALKEVNIAGDIFYKASITEPVFSGTFDGNGNTIYGLRITKDDDAKFSGFFRALDHATIKNVVFENVTIESCNKDKSVATVCGYANASTFINVIVSGKIRAVSCAGIACVAMDTSFYNCINRASLISKSNDLYADVTVGGIVGQISLSNKMVTKIHQKNPMLFNRCIQNGFITIHSNHASHVWAGHLYGCLAHDPKAETYGIIIDRCEFSNEILVYNLDQTVTKAVFFGKKDLKSYPTNFTSSIGEKVDLLNGLLGKTSTAINVNVNKITGSTVIDNIVLPGSLNVLRSESFTNSFVTVDTNPITSEDGIANLEPYFVFVKTGKI